MANHGSGMAVLAPRDLRAGQEQGIEAAAAQLERLLWPLAARSVEEGALRCLEFALDEAGQLRGVLGAFDPMGRLSVLASCDRQPGDDICLPQTVLDEARRAPAPFVAGQWLIVPLGPEPMGVLAVGGRSLDGVMDRSSLRLTEALGELMRARVTELRMVAELDKEIRRLRFQRTPAHATIHCSIRLNPLFPPLKEAARHRRPVLIVGEDGTEKEDLAHYLHAQGTTSPGPFVPFYPAVLQEHRVEEALFGTAEAHGALHRARGGTLYIEGPGQLPVQVQTRLLGSVIDGSYERRGEILPLDMRIVASVIDRSRCTDLLEELALVLADTEIHVPPLRGHSEDINSLTELVLSEMGPGPDGRPRELTPAARRRLLDHRWEGNLRQLRAVLEGAAARSGHLPIAERHLPDELRNSEGTDEAGLVKLVDVEREYIERVLHAVGGRRAKAANVLGIATSTLYEKLKRYGLEG